MKKFRRLLMFSALCVVGGVHGQQLPQGATQSHQIDLGNSALFHGESSGYPMVVDAPVVAPLFLETEHFTSTLHLVNSASSTEPATIVVRTPDGNSITTKLTLPGHDSLTLPLKSLLKGVVASRGSLEVYATDPIGSSLTGQLEITYNGEERRAAIDEELLMPSMTTSHTLRGISLESDTLPVVAISNVANTPVLVNVTCNRSAGTPLTNSLQLGRHDTKFVRACSGAPFEVTDDTALLQALDTSKASETIGIQISSEDPKSELQAFGLTLHNVLGHRYFSAINFNDPKEWNSTQSIYAGVPVGYFQPLANTFSPRFSFSNFSNQSQTVTLQGYKAKSGEPSESAAARTIVLPANSSSSFAIVGDPNSSELISYVATSTGMAGDVIAALMDESGTGDNRFLIIGKDASTVLNAGMHPWTADKENHGILVAFNHTSKPQDVTVQIGNGTGGLWQRRITLKPYQTLTQDLNELLLSSDQPDDRGNLLPKNLDHGEVTWWTNDSRRVTGRLFQISNSDRMVKNFSCYGQIVLCQILASATPSVGNVGSSFHFTSTISYCTTNYGGSSSQCYGPNASGGAGATYHWNTYGAFQVTSSSNYDAYANAVGGGNGTAQVQAQSAQCTVNGQAPVTVRAPTRSQIINSTYTGLQVCGNGQQTGHERDLYEQIVDNQNPAQPFLADGVTVGEVITKSSPDDFAWGSGTKTGSGPTAYKNAPNSSPQHGVFTDALYNCDAALNACLAGGGGGKLSVLNQQLTYGGVNVPTINSLHETCTGFTNNGN